MRGRVRHARPKVLATFTTGAGVTGDQYLAVLPLGARYAVRSLRFRALPGAPPLRLVRAGLFDAEARAPLGVSTAAAYVSDEVRLAEAAGTPLVSLFEVRRGSGPAWVVESLRRLPDAERVLEALRAPTRFGVDPRREALAAEADVRGVVLPRAAARNRPTSRGRRRRAHRGAGGGPGAAGDRRGLRPRLRARASTAARRACCASTATVSAWCFRKAPTASC